MCLVPVAVPTHRREGLPGLLLATATVRRRRNCRRNGFVPSIRSDEVFCPIVMKGASVDLSTANVYEQLRPFLPNIRVELELVG